MHLSKDEQQRQNINGFIDYPKYPDLSEYVCRYGTKEVLISLYNIECSITNLKNLLISNELHGENRYFPVDNIKFSLYDLYRAKRLLKKTLPKRRKNT